MNKEEAKEKVADLVAKYEHFRPAEVKSYHEAKTKQVFSGLSSSTWDGTFSILTRLPLRRRPPKEEWTTPLN